MPYADPDQRRAYQRAYRQATRDKRAARRPDDDRARHANRRAREAGVPGRITIADVRAILHPGAACAYCGTSDNLGLDHTIPLSDGGPNTRANLRAACRPCNARKYVRALPTSWAKNTDQCLGCGTSERPHVARGMCSPCYQRTYRRPRRVSD